MKGKHVHPDQMVLKELMLACGRCQQMDKAFDIFEEITTYKMENGWFLVASLDEGLL
jgi:pentatricopeptide repeat protein